MRNTRGQLQNENVPHQAHSLVLPSPLQSSSAQGASVNLCQKKKSPREQHPEGKGAKGAGEEPQPAESKGSSTRRREITPFVGSPHVPSPRCLSREGRAPLQHLPVPDELCSSLTTHRLSLLTALHITRTSPVAARSVAAAASK